MLLLPYHLQHEGIEGSVQELVVSPHQEVHGVCLV